MFKIKHHCSNREYYTYREMILDRIEKKDIDSYIEPNHDYDVGYEDYNHMVKGIDILHKHIEQDSVIGILVDVDVDGYSSSAMLVQFLREQSIEPIIIHHKAKMHGLYDWSMEQIFKQELDCIILPDSSSNDIDEIIKLSKFMDVIVLDHHDISNKRFYSDDVRILGGVALVNNQSKLNANTNKELTGSGMTLRFLEGYYDRVFKQSMGYKYYDLAMLGLIGDMADYSDYEIRNIVFKGLENLSNKLVTTSLKEKIPQGVNNDIGHYTPLDIAFHFNPLINAVTRVASMEEKELVFSVLADNNISDTITETRKRKRGNEFQDVEIEFNYYEYVFDMMDKVKGRQDRLVRKLESDLYENINNENGIAIGLIDEDYKGITGLVANRVASNLQKPTLLFREKEDTKMLSGSARGYDRVLDDFKEWCQSTELFELAEGHDNAFGIQIREDYIDELIKHADDIESLEKTYMVDITFDQDNNMDKDDIRELNNLKYLVGGGVDEIKVGISNLIVHKDNVKSYKTVSKIVIERGLEIVLFNDNGKIQDLVNSTLGDYVSFDVVGTPSINHWLGTVTYQIIADDIKLHEDNTLIDKSPVMCDLLF